MHRRFLIIGAILAGLSVALGAFGAHGLERLVSSESVLTFETGVRYQLYHSFALVIAGILFERFANKWIAYAGNLFLTGIVLFSGSLYLLTILKITETVGTRGIGLITPIGGLFFIGGWICLFFGIAAKTALPHNPNGK